MLWLYVVFSLVAVVPGTPSDGYKKQSVLTPGVNNPAADDQDVYQLWLKLHLTLPVDEKKKLKKELINLLKKRKDIDDKVARILKLVTNGDEKQIKKIEKEYHPITIDVIYCYEPVVDYFHKECIDIAKNMYAMGHLYKFANICATKYKTADVVIKAMEETCGGR